MKYVVKAKYSIELDIVVNAESETEAKACADLTLQNTNPEFHVMQTWGMYDSESEIGAKVGRIEDQDFAEWEILEVN